ncbi:MAG: hypothetical protein J6O55_08790 [Lachnospiraceae bacterium]|nr:hypothetical protein [Lachnospiraceae bacterium]
MKQMEKEIEALYDLCGIPSELDYPVVTDLNKGKLNNTLRSDNDAFTRNSSFSYSACGASSVGFDQLSENGFKF